VIAQQARLGLITQKKMHLFAFFACNCCFFFVALSVGWGEILMGSVVLSLKILVT
tara:strand:+ start:339 stop:503 length:165 start_codon:yes stop_codon:yes gene_type:complete